MTCIDICRESLVLLDKLTFLSLVCFNCQHGINVGRQISLIAILVCHCA